MDNIKVSVVIPVYNAEKTLSKCIDSLTNQTYSNIEIICTNDCSKDNSLSILEQCAKKDKRIIIFNHKENKNAGGARNTGIRAASGEYICFVDQDDWLRQDAIEVLVKASNGGNIDCIVADWIEYYNESKQIAKKNLTHTSNIDSNVKFSLLNGFRMLGDLFKKEIFVKNNLFFPENIFYEDNAVGFLLVYCAKSIVSINDTLYFYNNTNPESTTHRVSKNLVTDRLKTANLLIENSIRLGAYEQYRDYINYNYLCLLKNSLSMLAQCSNEQVKPLKKEILQLFSSAMPNQQINLLPYKQLWKFKHPNLFYNLSTLKEKFANNGELHL